MPTTYIYRSAKTGRIVTEKWANKHPTTTTKERVKLSITIGTVSLTNKAVK